MPRVLLVPIASLLLPIRASSFSHAARSVCGSDASTLPRCAFCPLLAGWAGIVVNGCIRDSEALADVDIGVKALASNPMKPGKSQPVGLRDVPVVIGGTVIQPGYWLYSDDGEAQRPRCASRARCRWCFPALWLHTMRVACLSLTVCRRPAAACCWHSPKLGSPCEGQSVASLHC